MRTREDLESYLMRSGLPYEEVDTDDGPMWVVRDSDTGENIVVRMIDGLVVFRVKVLELERVSRRQALYEKLLELNASDMVHGSYGIDDSAVVLTCVLRLSNLDYEEYRGTIDDFSLALSNHYSVLSAFRDAA